MSRRTSKCSVCTGDAGLVSEVNNLIASGVKLTKIHEAYPDLCSYPALSRHKNRCLTPQPVVETMSTIDECRLWLSRAHSTFQSAVAIGDNRGASQAIGTATKTLTKLIDLEEKEQEAKEAATPDDDPSRPISIAYLDQQLKEFMAKRDAENDGVMQKAQTLIMAEPAFSTIIFAIWSNRALLPILLEGVIQSANTN